MAGSVGWGWFSAVRFEFSNIIVLVPGSAFILVLMVLFTPASTAAVLGTGLGILSGVVFGRLNGRFIVEGLTRRGETLRRWTDPTPASALLTLAPVVLVCAAGLAILAGLAGYRDLADLIVGSTMFFCWQGALHSVVNARILSGFERTSGRRVKAKMAWTAFEYKAE